MSDAPGRRLYSVANVNRGLARRLDDLPAIWVEGELAECNVNPAWGVVYMVLRDRAENASLRVRMPRWRFDRLAIAPAPGAHVQVHGRIELWERSAELALVADALEIAGEGELLARIEALRRRLAAEGVFDDARKRPLPFWPRTIGIVCGRGAAAPRDVISGARRRFPAAAFVLAQTAVQGPEAAAGIVRRIAELDAEPDVDVIVVTRGGGSLEDSLPFSDESVCRAICACSTPVVSAIGHERDTPLCDLAADVRASTPTAAATLIVPDRDELVVRLDQLRGAARRCAGRSLADARRSLAALAQRPALRSPRFWVDHRLSALERDRLRLTAARDRIVPPARERVDATAARLRAVAPGATLARGYSIAFARDGSAISDAGALQRGDEVRLRFARGAAAARIEEVET